VREAVARECEPGGLLARGGGVLVACSGGADSVALAAAIAERPDLRASIGHVDHGLRPGSAGEAEGLRSLAARLGLPFLLERLEGLEEAIARDGLEAAARAARYQALARLAKSAGAQLIATAHTRRDQAETVLLRLARGAGPGAIAGVRRHRQLETATLVRPLLGVPRLATERLCAELALPVLDDPHNRDPRRARSRLRQGWPLLEELLSPRLEEALAKTARLVADEDDLLSALSESALRAATGSGDRGLELARLRLLHPALLRRALLLAAQRASVRPEQGHLEELLALLPRPRFALALPGGVARAASGRLWFEENRLPREARPLEELAIEQPGSYAWQGRLFVLFAGEAKGERSVDLSRAPLPWTLRKRRPGDRFRPGGGHSKKISELWIDAQVPRETRANLAVLSDAAGIVFYVEGLRPGEQTLGTLQQPQPFALRPEMDARADGFGTLRPHDSASVTMTNRSGHDEESR